ncbi:hypothetical protein HMPREF3213_01742 [Heyndrickxia coagulans]|uniref:Uncharacterized protein n=1 Tax=Heyndrickxia coagulans TaxID=1398 RepID=A0A133KSQ7_HEYCO|nr:hypothetical protein HMPREF3213_01742 [Heyndrickxia coagulans]
MFPSFFHFGENGIIHNPILAPFYAKINKNLNISADFLHNFYVNILQGKRFIYCFLL